MFAKNNSSSLNTIIMANAKKPIYLTTYAIHDKPDAEFIIHFVSEMRRIVSPAHIDQRGKFAIG